MTGDPFTTPGRVTPPRVARPGEPLFEFLRGHDRFLCELRYHGEWRVEAQFFKNEELDGWNTPDWRRGRQSARLGRRPSVSDRRVGVYGVPALSLTAGVMFRSG